MLALLVTLGLPWTLRPEDITTLVKIFGLGYVVKQYAAPLNDFVNSVLANKGVAVREKTKVVPVLTVGVGQLYRPAQVSGPTAALAKIEAVAQLEADFNTVFRIKALVPINSTNPIADGIHRVPGVGVTAVIDIRI
jgi:hypothetical protein